jgi:hypothetical protein
MCTLAEGANLVFLINRDQNHCAAPSIYVRRLNDDAGGVGEELVPSPND